MCARAAFPVDSPFLRLTDSEIRILRALLAMVFNLGEETEDGRDGIVYGPGDEVGWARRDGWNCLG